MLVSLNWIRDFVDITFDEAEKLLPKFTLSTAEIENVHKKGGDLKGIVCAEIKSVTEIAGSKNHLLDLDTGDGKLTQCVCGAPNVRVGMRVAFVAAGGRAGGKDIVAAEISGKMSYGMCCSEAELGISDDKSGLMEISNECLLGADIKKAMRLEDIVFEVDNKSLTNRPDLWGHYGIAREFAALAGKPLKEPNIANLSEYAKLPALDIKIKSDKVYRYSAIKAGNITVKRSPAIVKVRLGYCGIRSINLLADITNYVMLELGQPMHAFDAKKINGIRVRDGFSDFKFKTLDGNVHELDKNAVMICDNEKHIAIAGIMGGANSEISDDTDSFVLESANFDAVAVRKTSTAIKLRTDSSLRYEKALDPELCEIATARAVQLLLSIDGGAKIISSYTDVYIKKYPVITIKITKNFVDRYTGIDIAKQDIGDILQSLGFHVKHFKNDEFLVTVPTWRATKDVSTKADLVEEISRIYGYDNFEVKTTLSPLAPALPSRAKHIERATKDVLSGKFALNEVNSYIWCDEKQLKKIGLSADGVISLLNPQAPENKLIRKSIVPSLLTIIAENREFAADFGVYEIGRTVIALNKDDLAEEKKMLGVVLFSKTLTENSLILKMRDIVDSLVVKTIGDATIYKSSETFADWAHPVNSWSVGIGGTLFGQMASLHPNICSTIDKKSVIVAIEIDMGVLGEVPRATFKLKDVSKFPETYLDFNLRIKENTTFFELSQAWKKLNANEIVRVTVLSTFKDDDGRSIALRFVFGSNERTLTRDDISGLETQILKNFEKMGYALKK